MHYAQAEDGSVTPSDKLPVGQLVRMWMIVKMAIGSSRDSRQASAKVAPTHSGDTVRAPSPRRSCTPTLHQRYRIAAHDLR